MNISEIILLANWFIAIGIYSYFSYDEYTNCRSLNPIITWLRRHDDTLDIIFFITGYYSIVGLLVWVAE